MSVRKQRATTSATYVCDADYEKALKQAKRIHRDDCKFYLSCDNTFNIWCSESEFHYNLWKKKTKLKGRNYLDYFAKLEHWEFNKDTKRWNKVVIK